MSLSWHQRKERLAVLLKSNGDDDIDGLALDRLMHGQNVIGKTAKTTEVDSLKFQDRDMDHVGTLEHGQYGVIDVVTCRLNNSVYVRKSVDKSFAMRTRDQCSPQYERDLLLQALKTESPWAPHLLCAYQTPTHLKLVMDYAEGGTLWDVLESSPHDGRILEEDLRWWMPQAVSAIHWCHSQGFAHRDIKPHNFVLTSNAHILLIDFGSAAPLLPPNDDGSQLLPKRHCLVPCGTCDYISPEILQAHEEALVAMEMDDDEFPSSKPPIEDAAGYGLETDWWSLGAMLYEMAYGTAPFFAPDIRSTYLRIMNHEKSLKFPKNVLVSHEFQHFLRRLLTNASKRLGRRNVMEVTDHPVFENVDWRSLHLQTAPPNIHLPQFVYSEPKNLNSEVPKATITEDPSRSSSQGFAFSAFFQSSPASAEVPGLRPSPGSSSYLHASLSSSTTSSSFIGFSWGPTFDAFPRNHLPVARTPSPQVEPPPLPSLFLRTPAFPQQTPIPPNRTKSLAVPLTWGPGAFGTPSPLRGYSTPMKPYAASPHATLPRTSTIRRTAPRRNVSDREAMKQLVDCVGMSARKKVLESGKKPKFLSIFATKSGSTNGTGKSSGAGTLRKELRFDKVAVPIPGPDYSAVGSAHEKSRSRSNSLSRSFSRILANTTSNSQVPIRSEISDSQHFTNDIQDVDYLTDDGQHSSTGSETTDSEIGGHPPSPSPSPRPGSAMSMMSMTMLSRRSATPTVSGYLSAIGSASSVQHRTRSNSGSADRSVTATITMTSTTGATTATTAATSSGYLTVPSTATADKTNFRLGPLPLRTQEEDEKAEAEIQMAQDMMQPHTAAVQTSNPTLKPPSIEQEGHEIPQVYSMLPGSDLWLEELERRHMAMMQSIRSIERRLDELSPFIRDS